MALTLCDGTEGNYLRKANELLVVIVSRACLLARISSPIRKEFWEPRKRKEQDKARFRTSQEKEEKEKDLDASYSRWMMHDKNEGKGFVRECLGLRLRNEFLK